MSISALFSSRSFEKFHLHRPYYHFLESVLSVKIFFLKFHILTQILEKNCKCLKRIFNKKQKIFGIKTMYSGVI